MLAGITPGLGERIFEWTEDVTQLLSIWCAFYVKGPLLALEVVGCLVVTLEKVYLVREFVNEI